ncbi:preprotein translocase subunit SecA [Blochmannia endosymbiont of Colobopsis nipponica]|nr:preprotein translocase subunit SecA [Blochmannia endosymbiont of Colobopsis nipponica]QOI11260.1 preprotein translocase subunit SecA [Blochmannia endosymbiont of Colobopsis nipponica]
MLVRLFTKFFGNHNERVLRRMKKIVSIINEMEFDIKKLSDKQLSAKTNEFRMNLSHGININDLLPQAFAVVREASIRVFGMRHFDVQLLGGMVLNNRCVAEMRTGEGKTLTATLPAYLNALSGRGVHIVTVNDYLAQRDASNNRPLFEFLGLKVGINLPGQSLSEKKSAYAADITYGTNNEYGFDYLRDNMVFNSEDRVQRSLYYALIDEVDSILIDEARTPLIISGPMEGTSKLYYLVNKLIPYLIRQDKEDSDKFQGKGHFVVDEKTRQVILTERGLVLIEKLMVDAGIMNIGESLYSSSNIILMHHVNAALRAHVLFMREVDYIIKNGNVLIVDEHTGRVMPGRRWSDGLHQAIEAKENLIIQNENQTLASITFQNYFRLYEKLAGMTGTAYTESFEFKDIYKMDTIVIPTNCPMIRNDLPDLIYMTENEKIDAIIQDIKSCNKRGQPVLVGTISIEKSEVISNALKSAGIVHKVLNAKFHATEAEIISQAGKLGAVTIATNMAGRGTDIILGGNWRSELSSLDNIDEQSLLHMKSSWKRSHDAVLDVGGLHIIGTERHESRRIDNQLRGRSGRQGDVGSSRFYLSMDDSLMRIFVSDKVTDVMRKLGLKVGEAIEHSWISKTISHAQRKVENRNFDIRKQLLEYDDVSNDQRRVIYTQRNSLLDMDDIGDLVARIRDDVVTKLLMVYMPLPFLEKKWNISLLERRFRDDFYFNIYILKWLDKEPDLYTKGKELYKRVLVEFRSYHQLKKENIGYNIVRSIEKGIMLQVFDYLWKEHLAAMDYLRQGIHLRGYAQKDPKQEYKKEAFKMFANMLETLKYEVISKISKFLFNSSLTAKEISRNEDCPCKSGKRFKQCHGKL